MKSILSSVVCRALPASTIALALWALGPVSRTYANSADTPSTVTTPDSTITGTCTDGVATPTVVMTGVDQPISQTLGVMGDAVTGGLGAGEVAWSVPWTAYFNGSYIVDVTCYPDAPDPVSASSSAFTVNVPLNYSELTVSPTAQGAGWMAMAVVPGTETLTDVASGDLVLVLQDTAAQDEADAEGVEEYFPAGTEFTISYDTAGRRPRANYCMADCLSWSYSGGVITTNVKTVRQVKSDGSEYKSALGYLTTYSSNMDDVEGSIFSAIGVHYSDMSSTDPSVMTKRAGYTVTGFTGHTATFKMFAPDAVIAWMGIDDVESDWTGFLGGSSTGVETTKTRQSGGWLMQFTFTFASTQNPESGPPQSEPPDGSSYYLGGFYGVVFDDWTGAHVSKGANNVGGGADYISLAQSGDQVCINPPSDFSVTGVHVGQSEFVAGENCYTSSTGGRVDFGIVKNPAPAPTATVSSISTEVEQTSALISSAGGSVGYPATGLNLTFPAGAVPDGSSVTISPVSIGESDTSTVGFKVLGTASEVIVRGPAGELVSDFGINPVRVCYDYSDAQLMQAGGNVANLAVLRNPGQGDESALNGNRAVDVATRQICVDTNRLSTVARAARVPTALPVTGGVLDADAGLIGWIAAATALLAGRFAVTSWRRR